MKIVLIGGKARTGKDTAADFLTDILKKENINPCRVQVAQYPKYYAMKYFGWDGSEDTKPRDLLNKLSTEIIREKIDPEFHVKRLIEDIKILSYFYDYFIVSDIRFPIEIEKIKENFDDVTTIKMIRESDELDSSQKAHVSENALDDYEGFDFVIDNNKTLDDLKNKIEEIYRK